MTSSKTRQTISQGQEVSSSSAGPEWLTLVFVSTITRAHSLSIEMSHWALDEESSSQDRAGVLVGIFPPVVLFGSWYRLGPDPGSHLGPPIFTPGQPSSHPGPLIANKITFNTWLFGFNWRQYTVWKILKCCTAVGTPKYEANKSRREFQETENKQTFDQTNIASGR